MSSNEYIEIKELTKELIQQYVMNQYPWGGLITRPLTPVAMAILSVTYVIAITMLILSLIQIAVLVRYGITSLRYVRARNNGNNSLGRFSESLRDLPFISILIPIKNEDALTIERSLRTIASLNYPRELLEVLFISDDPEYYVNSLTKIIMPIASRLGINAG